VPASESETPAVKTDVVPAAVYAQPPKVEPSPELVVNTEDPEKTAATAPVVASVDTPSHDDALKLNPAPRYSDILGTVTLKRYETLSWIIQRVYGDFNSKYFKLFILANPDIIDPDKVVVGQMISVPAIPVNVTSLDKPLWWVKVAETDSMEAAFNLLRDHPDGSHPIRMIPYWNPINGTRFALVLKKLFTDERSARDQLEQLPAELSSNGMILSLFDENSVYFADPFFGRTQ
jgi:general secretion pathway protein A